jgi:hypothetical protein
LHSAQFIYELEFLNGDSVSFGSVTDVDDREKVYIQDSDDSIYIVDTLRRKNISFYTGSQGAERRANLMLGGGNGDRVPSSLWNSSNFSEIQLALPQMKYVSLPPNKYENQLLNVYSSPKHSERSGSYYPTMLVQVWATKFDSVTFPFADNSGVRRTEELSFERFDLKVIKDNNYTITPAALRKSEILGFKIPKGYLVTKNSDGDIKAENSSEQDIKDLHDLTYYYHFEKDYRQADGSNTPTYTQSLQFVDARIRETMPAWRNLIGDLYNTVTKDITDPEGEPNDDGYFTRTGRRTVVGTGTAEAVIVVKDPDSGIKLPFVEFIDRSGGVESAGEPQIFRPPDFGAE